MAWHGMASQDITLPSSLSTQPDLAQPSAATPIARQQHDWPGACAPPPKRRRKATSEGSDQEALDPPGEAFTLRRQDSLSGQPQQPEPAPALQHNAAFSALPTKARAHVPQAMAHFTRWYSQNSDPVNGRIETPVPEPPSTALYDSPQTGRLVGPVTTLPNTEMHPPFQSVWNNPAPSSAYAYGGQPWTNAGNFVSSPGHPSYQQNYTGGSPFSYPYVPTPTNPCVGHLSQAHHVPVSGTADRPILLDDDPPAQPGRANAASTQAQEHQTPGGGVPSQANPVVADKENSFSQLAELGPHVTSHPNTGLPNCAAPDFTKPDSAVQTQGNEPKPSRTNRAKTETASEEPDLCPEQAELVSLIEKGHNVFYTGSAGCGKSTVLKAFVKRLRAQGKQVRIVAPTGRAALNVGGVTTWAFAGWTPSSHKLPIAKIRQGAHGKSVWRRLTDTDVLVIDEISMVENLHLERLNILMKTARWDPKSPVQPAFGGCQIVVTGDFCQLPPVKPFQHCLECGREMTTKINDVGKLGHGCALHGEFADDDKWAFRSSAWEECNFVHFHLKTIHRQNDQKFIRMLQKCRLGHRMNESEISLLMDHNCRVSQATKLYSTRKEANDVNRAAFNQLKGVKHVYWCYDNFFWREFHPHLQRKGIRGEWGHQSDIASPPDTQRPLLALEDHRWAKCVELKRGMLVVLLINLDLNAGLCNGSQGVICGFENYEPNMMPMKERKNVEPKPGQRVLRGEHASVQENEIKKFIQSECAPVKKWPVVRFHNGAKRTVYAECSITQLGDEEPFSLLARTQIPLAPAWAMTIHKSQSLTLDRVIVNLSRAFEDGQVYVALSRATGLNGLKIEGDGGFLRNKLMVNSQVAAFLKEKFGDIYGATESDDEDTVPGDSLQESTGSQNSLNQ
jgi:ATP-dependent DNA helicase PIF1